jgi:hypothetical protein
VKDGTEEKRKRQEKINEADLHQEVIRKKMVGSIGKYCGGKYLHECRGYYGMDVSRVCYTCPN